MLIPAKYHAKGRARGAALRLALQDPIFAREFNKQRAKHQAAGKHEMVIKDHPESGGSIVSWIKSKATKAVKKVKNMIDDAIPDAVKRFVAPSKKFTNSARKTLEQFGNRHILSMAVARTPIQSAIHTAFDLLSMGKWSELRTKYKFEDFFHLSLICDLVGDGGGITRVCVEKNEVVNISTSFYSSEKTEYYPINLLGRDLSLGELIDNTLAAIGESRFFLYSWKDQNCQMFCNDILTYNNLLSDQAHDFIYQNIEELAKEMPEMASWTAQAATDVGASFRKLSGSGPAKKRKRKTESIDASVACILDYYRSLGMPI